MLKSVPPAALALVVICGTSTIVSAAAPDPSRPARDMIPIAVGCGVGSVRDARGICRHRFNRFRHHGSFRAYKQRHCKRVNTPNGRVGFCRI